MALRSAVITCAVPTLLVTLSVVGQEPKKEAGGGDGEDLAKILLNTKLWGKDFPKALATFPAWRGAGESQVVVHESQVVSKSTTDRQKQAEMTASFNATAKGARLTPRPAFAGMLRDAIPRAGAPAFQASVVESFPDDQKPRTVIAPPGSQFLAPGLDLATVKAQLGPPSRPPMARAIPTDGDRRPIVLTEYTYANGGAIFATSDLTPDPEGDPDKKPIDRVILSVPRVTAEVFQDQP